MRFDHLRPTYCEINLDHLSDNVQSIRTELGGRCSLNAVVKADAYGHGAVPIARLLQDLGVDMLSVALVEEGVALRRVGITLPILILSGVFDRQAGQVFENQLTPAVFTNEQASRLELEAKRRSATLPVHLKVDSGMGRIGLRLAELSSFLEQIDTCQHLIVEGVFTNLAAADDPASPMNNLQQERFHELSAQIEGTLGRIRYHHVANSAAFLGFPETHYNMVRIGLLLYGVQPSPMIRRIKVTPLLTWKSTVLQLKEVPAGTPIGYGATYVTECKRRIATVAVGYNDGIPFACSSRGEVLVRGQRAPIVGRVSMDLTTLDVSEIQAVGLGDEVVLIGRQGDEEILAEEVAERADTIPYVVVCGLGARVPRVFYRGGKQVEVLSSYLAH